MLEVIQLNNMLTLLIISYLIPYRISFKFCMDDNYDSYKDIENDSLEKGRLISFKY